MTYDEFDDAWDAFCELPAELDPDSCKHLAKVLLEYEPLIELTGDPAPCGGEPNDDTLLLLANEASTLLSFWRIPAANLDATLRDALARLDGRAFAGAADLAPDQWGAAVRVLAAQALEHRSAEELDEWARIEGANLVKVDKPSVTASATAESTRPGLEELRRLWGRWTPNEVTTWEGLSAPPARFCAIRRAM